MYRCIYIDVCAYISNYNIYMDTYIYIYVDMSVDLAIDPCRSPYSYLFIYTFGMNHRTGLDIYYLLRRGLF